MPRPHTHAVPSRPLPHERLDAFHVSIELVELAANLPPARGTAELRDQLRRAASSVALNLAEGAGKQGRDAARYFRIARGSACEAAAAVRVLLALKALRTEQYRHARRLCERLYAMLTRLAPPQA